MRFFSGPMSRAGRTQAIEMITYLQTLLAYQQLTLERFDHAIKALAESSSALADDVVAGETAALDVEGVRAHLLPWFEYKLGAIDQMQAAHFAVEVPSAAMTRRAHRDFGKLLLAMQTRAGMQEFRYSAWCEDPSREIDLAEFDKAEQAALDQARASLDELVADARVTREQRTSISRPAFNAVREAIGLPQLTEEEFLRRWSVRGEGQRVRFFSE